MIKNNILVFTLACLTPAMAAAHWQWSDDTGRMVFSDQPPPPSVPAHRVVRQPGVSTPPTQRSESAPAAGAASSARPGAPAASATRQPQDERVRVLQDHNARLLSAHCTRIRQGLDTIESGQRLARILPNGEREVLDDAARASERLRLQGILASDCNAL